MNYKTSVQIFRSDSSKLGVLKRAIGLPRSELICLMLDITETELHKDSALDHSTLERNNGAVSTCIVNINDLERLKVLQARFNTITSCTYNLRNIINILVDKYINSRDFKRRKIVL